MKLCYVENGVCYFTPLPLEEQWGDDWGDAPYEHNAGEPYDDDKITKVIILPKKWMYIKEPKDTNLAYSVEEINKGVVPWLNVTFEQDGLQISKPIYAGIELEAFITLMKKMQVEVYKRC